MARLSLNKIKVCFLPLTLNHRQMLVIFYLKGREDMNNKKRRTPPNFSGQHFIHNRKLIQEIVNHAKIKKDDIVFDLGAGKGALTIDLSKKAAKAIAVEYDRKFVECLNQKLKYDLNTKVVQQDILKIHFPRTPFVVVSNIPYAITTPIMKKLLHHPSNGFQKGILIMEKGAAKRFTSTFVKDAYVIAWRMLFDISYVKTISKENFSPQPKVDSAMISIKRKKQPIISKKNYFLFVGMADAMLRHAQLPVEVALKGIFTAPQIKHLKRKLAMKRNVSVSALSEQQWGIIFETMLNYVPVFRWPGKGKRSRFSL